MHIDKNNQPLVSIIVITYNSARFVLETLESAKAQTYQNIELIVSDDCSTDETVEICRKWIEENKERFIRTELISVEKNTGIPANCNRGVKAANGGWLKLIAGDDMLLKNSISDYIKYVIDKAEQVFAVHANMNEFIDDFQPENFKKFRDFSQDVFNRANISAYQQFFLLLRNNYISAPTFFIKRSLINDLGGFDELMPFEDWPMFLSITMKGIKIYYLNKATVNYRIHNASMWNNAVSNKLLFNDFFVKDKIVYYKYRRNHLTLVEQIIEDIEFKRKYFFFKFGLNKATNFIKCFNIISIFIYSYSKKVTFFVVKRQIKNFNENVED